LLILELRATSLLFENTLALGSPTLPAIHFLAILVGTLVLIRTPIALIVV
jgi:hypothetical protein